MPLPDVDANCALEISFQFEGRWGCEVSPALGSPPIEYSAGYADHLTLGMLAEPSAMLVCGNARDVAAIFVRQPRFVRYFASSHQPRGLVLGNAYGAPLLHRFAGFDDGGLSLHEQYQGNAQALAADYDVVVFVPGLHFSHVEELWNPDVLDALVGFVHLGKALVIANAGGTNYDQEAFNALAGQFGLTFNEIAHECQRDGGDGTCELRDGSLPIDCAAECGDDFDCSSLSYSAVCRGTQCEPRPCRSDGDCDRGRCTFCNTMFLDRDIHCGNLEGWGCTPFLPLGASCTAATEQRCSFNLCKGSYCTKRCGPGSNDGPCPAGWHCEWNTCNKPLDQ